MASQGPNAPGTGANDSSFGSNAWANPDRITADDSSLSSVTITSGTDTNYLKGTNFGFTIPSGATIDGIEVVWQKHTNVATSTYDRRVRIVKGGTIGSTDKSSGTAWPTTSTDTTYGSSSDLWGETWTDSDINNSGFGAVIAAYKSTSFPTPAVDILTIKVYYTAAAAGHPAARRFSQCAGYRPTAIGVGGVTIG